MTAHPHNFAGGAPLRAIDARAAALARADHAWRRLVLHRRSCAACAAGEPCGLGRALAESALGRES